MEDDYDFGFTEDPKFSVERYEEMIRNKEHYFFDSQAFEGIIDFYIEKNDPIKALQVVDYAVSQHPYVASFFIKQAQLLTIVSKTEQAFEALEKAQSLEPSEIEIYLIRGGIFSTLGRFDEAMAELNTALSLSENSADVLLHMSLLLQCKGDLEGAIVYLKRCLEDSM